MLTDVQAFSSRAYPLRAVHPLSTPFPPTGFQSVASENRQTPSASELSHPSRAVPFWVHLGIQSTRIADTVVGPADRQAIIV